MWSARVRDPKWTPGVHHYFTDDTDEPTVPLRYIQCIPHVKKVKIIVNIQVWMDKYFLHTLRTTIISKN